MTTSGRERIEQIFDAFEENESRVRGRDPIKFPGYPAARNRAAATSGEDESVITGIGLVGRYRVSAAIFDFGFLGGSLGEGAGRKIANAMSEAARQKIPFLCVTSSGGARMQEGMAALAQMPRTVAASNALARKGIPRISILGNPTTGGVYASFASLSEFIVAEQSATIGFAGPRVAQATTGTELPQGSHTAEAAFEAGLVDEVLAPEEIKGWLLRLLTALTQGPVAASGGGEEVGSREGAGEEVGSRDSELGSLGNDRHPASAFGAGLTIPSGDRGVGPPKAGDRGVGPPEAGDRGVGPPGAGGRGVGPPEAGGRGVGPPEAGETDAWREYGIARHPDRPPPRRYIQELFPGSVELRGDRISRDDPAMICAVGKFGAQPVMAIAIDRKSPDASGFRKARRGLETADRLRLPVVTFIDTPGADAGYESEYSGLAGEIARTFETILKIKVPVISVVTGEGTSGGALALACADIVGIQRHAVFSVISPEGAAEILHRDPGRASSVAHDLRPTSTDLVNLGLADEIIEEPLQGAHTEPQEAIEAVRSWLQRSLARASGQRRPRSRRYSAISSLEKLK